MKPKILDCEKNLIQIFHKHKCKPRALFYAASISMLWMGISDRSQAQMKSSPEELLRVPSSSIPKGRTKLELQKVPPPPNASRVNARSSTRIEQYLPLDSIEQIENSFIQEQITGNKRAIERSIAVTNAKSIGGPRTGIYEARQINAQAVPLPAPPGSTQEFSSPNFNSQVQATPLLLYHHFQVQILFSSRMQVVRLHSINC